VSLVFDVFLNGGGWAYIDDRSAPPACVNTPPNPTGSPCVTRFPAALGGPPPSGPAWTQVAITCDIDKGETAQLHIKGSATSPRQMFVATQDPRQSAQGSVYLLAVQTPIASTAMEEALLFVSGDRATNRLVYEAPLLP
jgi:hypothetical protein